ncbi:MAG: nucleoside-triphosphatase [Archaeoglobaceae archaeon]|nr:nucleoside-triphosphatase [Archaeoglobaceae archaeon]MDK2877048.1 nucleoside-triphosphatase [Archaeoglobaceae archaeon]
MKIAVTGRPGIGKTTLCLKVYESLKDKIRISGFITLEERAGGKRVGFKLVELSGGREAKLARVGKGKLMVGKYEVLLENFEKFLGELDLNGELVIIDEVGPMELKSQKFVSLVEELMKKEKLLFTVHYRANHPLAKKIRRDFRIYTIDESNRDQVAEEIVTLYDR